MSTYPTNTVSIQDNFSLIKNITYVANSFQITQGEGYILPPQFIFTPQLYFWSISVDCGRKASTPVANSFTQASGGAGHEYADGGGSTPGQLNFWFALNFEMTSGQNVVINIGQGSYGAVIPTNNWWIGSVSHIVIRNNIPYLEYQAGDTIYSIALQLSTNSILVNPAATRPASPIKNVFVLMLENHSFDNMLAAAPISGLDVSVAMKNFNSYGGQTYYVNSNGEQSMPTDPGHEFPDVVEQLCGQNMVFQKGSPYPPINNGGFAANYATSTTEGPAPPAADIDDIMRFLNSAQVPNLTTLATDFVVCDHWFSSLPGPTWPNRFFLHGASSNGLDHSPSEKEMLEWESVDGFTYPHGSIFDLLSKNNFSYKLYMDHTGPIVGWVPQVSSLNGIKIGYVHNLSELEGDLKSGYEYQYTFIEPSYGEVTGTYEGGTSQHPMDSTAGGEALIANVYNMIRSSPLWNQSVLIITYDEHGGFYDHVAPGTVIGPNDGSNTSSLNEYGFTFTTYGVRVPAVIVSPYLAAAVDHTVYDHTSMLATLEWLLGLPPLTARDHTANPIASILAASSSSLRTDTPVSLPVPTLAPTPHVAPEAQAARDAEPVPDRTSLTAFLGTALKADTEMADTAEGKAAARARYANVKTRRDAREYITDVVRRAEAKKVASKAEGV